MWSTMANCGRGRKASVLTNRSFTRMANANNSSYPVRSGAWLLLMTLWRAESERFSVSGGDGMVYVRNRLQLVRVAVSVARVAAVVNPSKSTTASFCHAVNGRVLVTAKGKATLNRAAKRPTSRINSVQWQVTSSACQALAWAASALLFVITRIGLEIPP